jgi:hypothetical protein
MHAALEQQLPDQVQRDAAEERERVEGAQRLALTGVRQHALDTQGGQHDASHEREVAIGVGLHGQVDLAVGLLRRAGHANIAAALRWVGRDTTRALALLGISSTP